MSTQTSAQPVLSVCHYKKVYGDRIAVPDLSLTVNAGDIFGYIGHNGAGFAEDRSRLQGAGFSC